MKRSSTTEQVRRELRSAILDGRIRPGEPLRETALAEAMGTGRSAVREALRQLVQEGLILAELNRGARARPIEVQDVIDVYRARKVIEGGAVADLLEREPPGDLGALRRAQERIYEASGGDATGAPSPELISADLDFHRAMVALAGSPRLSRAYEPLAAESQFLLNWHPLYSLSDYVSDHERLLEGVAAHDRDTVELVRAHLDLSCSLLLDEVAKRSEERVA